MFINKYKPLYHWGILWQSRESDRSLRSLSPRCQVHGAEGQADQGAQDGRDVPPFLGGRCGDSPSEHAVPMGAMGVDSINKLALTWFSYYQQYEENCLINGLVWRCLNGFTKTETMGFTWNYYEIWWFPVDFPWSNDLLLLVPVPVRDNLRGESWTSKLVNHWWRVT